MSSFPVFTALLTSLLVAGCSGGSPARPDAAAAGGTCQDVRRCVFVTCLSDIAQPCVQNCIDKASPAARMAYAALAACTLPYCHDGNSYCGCEQQCFIDGNCLPETEACVAASIDTSCSTDLPLCH